MKKLLLEIQNRLLLSTPDFMTPEVGVALDKLGSIHNLRRLEGESIKRFRARIKRTVNKKTYSPELRSKNNFVRMFRYLFSPNACWACGSYEGHHIVIDTMEMGDFRIPCEAEHRCGECGELHSQMSYSDWWPQIPFSLKGRIKYLQDELSYGPADVGVLCH